MAPGGGGGLHAATHSSPEPRCSAFTGEVGATDEPPESKRARRLAENIFFSISIFDTVGLGGSSASRSSAASYSAAKLDPMTVIGSARIYTDRERRDARCKGECGTANGQGAQRTSRPQTAASAATTLPAGVVGTTSPVSAAS